MNKIIRPLVLFTAASLILASCGIFGGADAEDGQAALPALQSTPTLADKVAVELTVQYDTAVQYNTVGQIVKFNYNVKMVKNDLTDNAPPNITFIGVTPVCPVINSVGNLDGRFDAGETITCTYEYPLTQADLDKGSVSNVATVNVYTVSSNQAVTSVPTVPSKLLTLTKSANPTSYYMAGQIITYTYVLKNSGSSPLGPAQFTVTDNKINNNAPFNCGNADATIASGATLTCTASYTVTSADLNAASITNSATAAGGGANASQPATATITKTTAPALTAGSTVQHKVVEGEWLWQIARCYGADPVKTVAANSQLSNPAQIKAGMIVTVPNIGSNGKIYAPQPCVTKHTVQSGDTWSSIAAKYGADPGLLATVNSNTLTVGKEVKVPLYTQGLNLPFPSTPGSGTNPLALTVTANPTTYNQAGQTITFNYVIKNNGTTTMGPATFNVTDPLVSASAFKCGGDNITLAAGATTNCSANYVITQADMNLASISNSATASASGVGTSSAVSVTVTKSGTALLKLTVTANPATYSQQGQVVTFKYVISNNGAGPVGPAQFTVTDPLVNASAFNCGPPNTLLAVNANVECTATYTITQADMNLASISDNATASGGGLAPSAPASTTITKSVALLTLSVSANPTTYNQAGQVIVFTYVITNSGTSTLGPAQFIVTDPLISASAFNCGPATTTLNAGQTATCTANYTITQPDMNLSSITNEAVASGGGAAPSQPARTTITKQ